MQQSKTDKITETRAFYLRGAFEGALAATSTADSEPSDDANKPKLTVLENGEVLETRPEQGDPAEFAYADALHKRYQSASREDLFNRVLSLEGYIFGSSGKEAPEDLEAYEDDGEDWGEMDESHFE